MIVREHSKKIGCGLILAGVVYMGGLMAHNMFHDLRTEYYWRVAAQCASKTVNSDGVGVISPQEYADIYRTLKLETSGKFALDLSRSQLEAYIAECESR